MANPSREETEHVLVEAAQAGDQSALDHLIGDHIDRVTVFVRNKVPREDVDDVAQEVLLAVIEMLPALKEPGAFRSSLWTIARRRIADYHRDRDPERVIRLTTVADLDGEGQGALERVEDRVTAEVLLEGMSQCSRVILRLHIEKGRSFSEVGRWIGISEGAARVRYYRTRSRIRQVGM